MKRMKKSALTAIVFVIISITFCTTLISGEDEEGFVCKEDVKYELEDTYPCTCLPDTNNALECDGPTDLYKKQDCIIGSSWMKQCNTCWCRAIGVICEKHECVYIKLNTK